MIKVKEKNKDIALAVIETTTYHNVIVDVVGMWKNYFSFSKCLLEGRRAFDRPDIPTRYEHSHTRFPLVLLL